jgi:hypothetical protein
MRGGALMATILRLITVLQTTPVGNGCVALILQERAALVNEHERIQGPR